MTASSCLRLFPLLLLLACESKPTVNTAPTAKLPAAAPTPTPPAAPKAASDTLQTFTWEDDVCQNTGTFAAGTYTQRQLRDTYWVVNGFSVLTNTSVFYFKDYNDTHFKQTAAQLRHEHDSLAALLHGLQVVPVAFWQKMKHLRELQLAEQYAQGQAELEGYFRPSSLLHNRYYSHCTAYADALASTDTATVLRAWRKLVDKEKINNGDPQHLEDEYVQESALPTGISYAKMELMTFGWSNCANELTKYSELAQQYRLTEHFEQLFKQVKQGDCVDVD